MLKEYLSTKTRWLDLRDRLAALRTDDGGAAMIEYAMIVGLVAVACVAALTTLQGDLGSAFNAISAKVANIQ